MMKIDIIYELFMSIFKVNNMNELICINFEDTINNNIELSFKTVNNFNYISWYNKEYNTIATYNEYQFRELIISLICNMRNINKFILLLQEKVINII
jgi:hypothetical protein